MVGVLFGALPGFSATMAVAVFVPFTYVMEPGPALLLLSALYCGGVYGGSIPAVLVGIPGTPASAPTALEGKAMVRRGKSRTGVESGYDRFLLRRIYKFCCTSDLRTDACKDCENGRTAGADVCSDFRTFCSRYAVSG